jgi:prophage DNA circulation protein
MSQFPQSLHAVMGMLTQIIDRLQSMDTRMTEGFRSMDDRFQVLEAHVAQIQINVQNTLCHLMPEDQRDQVP